MPKYDDFNLDLNKVVSNEKNDNAKDVSSKIVTNTIKLSIKLCDKTTEGKGCHPSYTNISPCNRTYME
ncbi:TPA: hypothetical protein KN630_000237 [Clostridioides difficile]|nr:hypothetical protein [Clostridioides difficile]